MRLLELVGELWSALARGDELTNRGEHYHAPLWPWVLGLLVLVGLAAWVLYQYGPASA